MIETILIIALKTIFILGLVSLGPIGWIVAILLWVMDEKDDNEEGGGDEE